MKYGNSSAPTERINIVYQPAKSTAREQAELPLKILMLGDYTGRPAEVPLEARKPISIDKGNFSDVMAQQQLELSLTVPNRLADEPGSTLGVALKFDSLDDFTPEGLARQVPALRDLLELRNALNALKGPLGNLPAFRKKLQALLARAEDRKRLIEELEREPPAPPDSPESPR